ncbi:MAG: DUF362 domain-containing protein [Candidatus Nealsonbacteria bacterium]|nr:DUF362 domain-containing protein [Candidatus Nealsonbacteria bacterium]
MAFYQCEKCKLTWQYPLEICPHCFTNLTEQIGRQARVIGVSRVGIPTLNHPSVPYFILLLQDENGNTWAHKSSKEYGIGAEFKTEAVLDAGAVAVWKVKYNYLEAINKVFELLGGIKIDGSSKILLLPTANAATHYYFRDNTSPQFFEAVLEYLLKSGAVLGNITVGAQSFDDIPIGAIAQKSGLLEVCQKHKIMPKDLSAGTFEKKGKFEIAKDALDADLILNLVMLKMGQASATQNLFKVLKKENFLGLKYLGSEADVAQNFKEIEGKTMTIADGENVQRSNKLTAFTGVVLAGRNAMNVDRIFNEITKANRLPELVKDVRIEDIPLAGRSILETQYQAEIF